MKNWYCKPASEAEAIEIVERAVANGAVERDVVSVMAIDGYKYKWNVFSFWGVHDGKTITFGATQPAGEQLTIQQVREQFPLPNEVNDMRDKKEWKGPQDGLPPVGTVCEVLCPDNEWHKTFIVGTDDDGYTVFTAHESPDFYKYGGTRDAAAFRPLRTEREKWVEQVVSGLSGDKVTLKLVDGVAGEIYDALKSGALKAPEVE